MQLIELRLFQLNKSSGQAITDDVVSNMHESMLGINLHVMADYKLHYHPANVFMASLYLLVNIQISGSTISPNVLFFSSTVLSIDSTIPRAVVCAWP